MLHITIEYIISKLLKKLRGKSVLNSTIHKTSKIESGSLVVNSVMDKYSFCGYDCEIINCEIGSFCSIANNVIMGGAMHPIEWVSTSPVFYAGRDSVKKKFQQFNRPDDKKTYIQNDVWIGNYTLIKQGVTIGHGAIIGMGSVITKDIPPYEIWAGNPARFIRKRFSDDIIDKIIKSEWWNLDDTKLKEVSEYFNDIEKTLNTFFK